MAARFGVYGRFGAFWALFGVIWRSFACTQPTKPDFAPGLGSYETGAGGKLHRSARTGACIL